MARLPWQHTRSRTKSGSDKSISQEWFSRTAEPSRQALTELVKAHKREKSDETIEGPRPRSRAPTISSLDWQKHHSRTDSSTEAHSTPGSPKHARSSSVCSSLEKSDGTNKSLLAKSSMILRRTGSKMSLASTGSGSTLGMTSPPRTASNLSALRTSPSRDELKPKISAPFDFQHITHTEQGQFAGLGRIEETELVQRFSFATKQNPVNDLKGIDASDLTLNTTQDLNRHAEGADIQGDTFPELPSTPPRPAPPPKDVYTVTGTIPSPHQLTHSIDDHHQYSAPPQLEPLPIVDTSSLGDVVLPLSYSTDSLADGLSNINLAAKPLPQLPIVHAVTTTDDSARAMIGMPLPTPPGISPSSEHDYTARRFHLRQKSSLALPRHHSFYPLNKTSMPDLQSADRSSMPKNTLSRHHSDMALSRSVNDYYNTSSARGSVSFAAIDIMNWEDAVDEAWDEDDAALDSFLESNSSTSNVNTSATSTPLMMTNTQRVTQVPPEKTSPHIGLEVHKLESVQEDENQDALAGLGISQCPPSGSFASTTTSASRTSSMHFMRQRSSAASLNRGDTLTRSSSQESIIMSLASSIIGTQRSSNSSVNAEDLLNMTSKYNTYNEEDFIRAYQDDSMNDSVIQKVRPESGCLPPDMIKQLNQSFNSEPEMFTALPPMPNKPEHKYHLPAAPVPPRRSSVVGSDSNKSGRKRSNTADSRIRQSTRVSYSLFPTGVSPPLAPSVAS